MAYWTNSEYWDAKRAKRGLRTLRIVVGAFFAMTTAALIVVVRESVNLFLSGGDFSLSSSTLHTIAVILI
ncbi:MAG: hypothetical protein ABSE82_12185, partial [Nitrososphaerales archaeon]